MQRAMKRNTYIIPALCLTALLSGTATVQAQTEQTNEKNLNREMTLEREYDPSVQDANKVNTLPVIKEPEVKKMAIDYATYTVPANPEQEIDLLPPGQIMTQIDYNKRRGYVNLAGGTYMNLNGDLGYHILNDDVNKLNLWFSHRSTNGKVKYIDFDQKQKAKLNDNIGGLNFAHAFSPLTLNIGFKYGYTGYNYYGIPAIANSSSATISDLLENSGLDRDKNQVNQTVQGTIGVRSNDESAFGYAVQLGYTNFSRKYALTPDIDGVKQHAFDADFDFFAPFGDQRIGVAGKINYFNYTVPKENSFDLYSFDNNMQGTISPYYQIEGESWHVQLGANLLFITGDHSKITASPNIEAGIEVADKTELYVSATGGLTGNSAYQMAQINRYIDPASDLEASRNNLNATLGIKSAIATGFWFDIFGGYNITKNDVFFIPYSLSGNMDAFGNSLNAIQLNSDRLFIGANFKYSYQQLFDINLKGVYNHWKVSVPSGEDRIGNSSGDADFKAYGKPEMELTAGITVRPISNITAMLDYTLQTGRKTLVGSDNINMKNINELNLTGLYTLNDTFGLYLKLNNVLFQKYEMYYGYPLQSFSAMVGVNINF